MKEQILKIAKDLEQGMITENEAQTLLLGLFGVSVSLPHESQIESALDKLLIIRGEHPARVRNPLYGEERQLAIDLVKYVLLSNER
jgi:hypothetical protein